MNLSPPASCSVYRLTAYACIHDALPMCTARGQALQEVLCVMHLRSLSCRWCDLTKQLPLIMCAVVQSMGMASYNRLSPVCLLEW
jgi:hypothetical protein